MLSETRLLIAVALAFGLAAAGCAGGVMAATGAFDRDAPLAERAARLAPHAKLILPEGATPDAPAPAVALFSGCGGVREVQSVYAEALVEAGYAALIVDSHAARGIGRLGARLTVCTGLRMWGQARARDVDAALALLAETPGVDADRVGLVGWSHGGWTLMDRASLADLPGVDLMVLVYPYCGAITRSDTRPPDAAPPAFALLAGRDAIADPEACERAFARWRAAGLEVEIARFPDATHAFDAPDQPWDPRMRYDPALARIAVARVVARLDAAFADAEQAGPETR